MTNDMWQNDKEEFSHIIGRNGEKTSWYIGHIGDIIFANYAVEVFQGYLTSELSSCPNCEQCPSSRDYIECVDACQHDPSCVESNCNNDEYCPTDCPDNQFMDD